MVAGNAFADYVADVETDEAVRQTKELHEISVNLEAGSEAERDFDAAVAQRRGGEKRSLNQAASRM